MRMLELGERERVPTASSEHPDPAVTEDGSILDLAITQCSRFFLNYFI